MNKILKGVLLTLISLVMVFSVGCKEPIPEETPKEITVKQQNMRSIVEIYNTYPSGESLTSAFGSGVIIEENEEGDVYVATNLHVVSGGLQKDGTFLEGCETIVSFLGADKLNGLKAEIIGFYKNFDIAVLFVKDFKDKFSIVCPIEKEFPEPIVTEKVRVIANALGKGTSVTEGIVSKASEYINMGVSYQQEPITIRQIRVDASMNQGCSGGGVFNEDGKFLGMVNARSSKEGVDDFGYVIPSATVIPLTEKIISSHKEGQVDNSLFNLGAEVIEVNPNYTWDEEENTIKTKYVVKVSSVANGTIASVFLKKDDELFSVKVNDKLTLINREFQLDGALYGIKTGDEITFKYIREGEIKEYAFSVDKAYMAQE